MSKSFMSVNSLDSEINHNSYSAKILREAKLNEKYFYNLF